MPAKLLEPHSDTTFANLLDKKDKLTLALHDPLHVNSKAITSINDELNARLT